MRVFLAAALLAAPAVAAPPLAPPGNDALLDRCAAVERVAAGLPLSGQYLVSDREDDCGGLLGSLRGDADLPWRWASVTKQIVAVAVMREVEAGRLALDTPVAAYAPGLKIANAGRITLRMLLQHTSGLPNVEDGALDARGEMLVQYRYDAPRAAGISPICLGPAKREPGARFEYNNCDTEVVGAVLEAVTHRPLADVLAVDVFTPAGMTGTRLVAPGEKPFGRPGYFTDGRDDSFVDLGRFGAAAAVAGPPADLARFDRALLNDALLKPGVACGDGARRSQARLCRARRLVVHRALARLRPARPPRRAARRDRRRAGAERHRARSGPRADRLHRPPVRVRRGVAGQGRQLHPVLGGALPGDGAMSRVRLGVNIDHVATIRNARGGDHPDPVRAAELAVAAGADGITAHLREDRRHIRDDDLKRLMAALTVPLNLEMAATEEMLGIALAYAPHAVCVVPEKRAERTTEGGLDVLGQQAGLRHVVERLTTRGCRVSLFIEPDPDQIEASAAIGAAVVELHTGRYAHLDAASRAGELERLQVGATLAAARGLEVHAGHGLTFANVAPVAAIPEVAELNIGHFLIGEAVFTGLEAAIRAMREAIDHARPPAGGRPTGRS